jgi:hypothetical protein
MVELHMLHVTAENKEDVRGLTRAGGEDNAAQDSLRSGKRGMQESHATLSTRYILKKSNRRFDARGIRRCANRESERTASPCHIGSNWRHKKVTACDGFLYDGQFLMCKRQSKWMADDLKELRAED